jgi:predicted dinucleotide-binding enzyme
MFPVFERRGKGEPPDLIDCADDERAQGTAARLIRDVGFNPVDIGALSIARYVEPFSLLVAIRLVKDCRQSDRDIVSSEMPACGPR